MLRGTAAHELVGTRNEGSREQAHNPRMAATRNLLDEVPAGVDLYELRALLDLRIGGPGQYDGESKRRLYLPQARDACRVVLIYAKDSLATLQRIERGAAFDENQWHQVLKEVQDSLLSGPMRVGRDYCFSGRRVLGSWRGMKSGIQILPAPVGVPRAPVETAQHPFVLECPLQETREWRVTNDRRRRQVRTAAMLLNVLLNTTIRPHWAVQPDHLWVSVPGVDTRRFKFDRLRRWFRLPPRPSPSRIEWAQEFFFAPLNPVVMDELSPPAATQIQEVESDLYRGDPLRRPMSDGLQVPTDLDDSLYAYSRLLKQPERRLNRSLYWMQLASRFGYRYMGPSFLSMVSAIEALGAAEVSHTAQCTECGGTFVHRVPGPTEAFRNFLSTYAPGPQLNSRRSDMYSLRSGLVHGNVLMELDDERHSVWDPAHNQQIDLWSELFGITRIAIRNWLNDPSHVRSASG